MSELKKLSFEQELELSEALRARYLLRQRLREEQGTTRGAVDLSALSNEEKDVWERGNKASAALVEAYYPAIKSLSIDVARTYNITSETTPSTDDLLSAGCIAALDVSWSFNLGSGGGKNNPKQAPHRGRRFRSYASPHILKIMKRVVFKEKTPFSLDIEAIKASWAWQAAEERLKDENGGTQPTDEEIRSAIHFKTGNVKIEPSLPMRSSFEDVNLPVGAKGAPAAFKQNTPTVKISADDDEYKEILMRVLYRVFEDKTFVSDVIDYFGLESGFPRDHTELREIWGANLRDTLLRIDRIKFYINHPKFRAPLFEEIKKENDSRKIIGQ